MAKFTLKIDENEHAQLGVHSGWLFQRLSAFAIEMTGENVSQSTWIQPYSTYLISRKLKKNLS